MENYDNFVQENVALEVTENSKKHLKTASLWSKIMAIIDFVGIGLLLLSALVFIPMGAFIGRQIDLPFSLSFYGFFMLILAVVIFFPTLYLYRFSQKIDQALAVNDTLLLEQALKSMKCYWKLTGIITIVLLALSVIAIPIIMIATVAWAGTV